MFQVSQQQQRQLESGLFEQRFFVPGDLVGLAIGKEGVNVNEVRRMDGIVSVEFEDHSSMFRVRAEVSRLVWVSARAWCYEGVCFTPSSSDTRGAGQSKRATAVRKGHSPHSKKPCRSASVDNVSLFVMFHQYTHTSHPFLLHTHTHLTPLPPTHTPTSHPSLLHTHSPHTPPSYTHTHTSHPSHS